MSDRHVEIESERQNHFGRLLLNAHRAFSEGFMRRLQAHGFSQGNMNLAHITVAASIPMEGIRITRLARTAGMTKQSMGEFVRDLEAAGLVERMPDPGDGRAVLVRFSRRGEEMMQQALHVKHAMEREYQDLLGSDTFALVQTALTRIVKYEESRRS